MGNILSSYIEIWNEYFFVVLLEESWKSGSLKINYYYDGDFGEKEMPLFLWYRETSIIAIKNESSRENNILRIENKKTVECPTTTITKMNERVWKYS